MKTDLHVNVGTFRPKWLRSKSNRVRVHFDFSIDMPESESNEFVSDLRESMIELLTRWSRSSWVKMQKLEDKRKKEERCRKSVK